MIHWNVNPIFIDFGPIQIRYYGLCFLAGFLIGYNIMRWMCKREGKNFEELDALLTYVIAGTIIGARLGHVLFYDPSYYLSNPLEILQVWKGGLASHGGTVGVILALWLFSRKHPAFPMLWLLDRVSIPVAITSCLIRIGNLINSEILGKPTNLPWSFVFEKVDQIPRHPAQLYESLTYLALFVTTLTIYKRNSKPPGGLIFGISMCWIFASRIVWEFFKENQEPFEAGMILNMGQILSIPFVILGLVLVMRALYRPKRTV